MHPAEQCQVELLLCNIRLQLELLFLKHFLHGALRIAHSPIGFLVVAVAPGGLESSSTAKF